MKNTEGLKEPWRKGESGNPNGRPKKPYSITAMLRQEGDVEVAPGKTKAMVLAERLWNLALEEGDTSVALKIIERLEGMPKQPIEHSEAYVSEIVLVTDERSKGPTEAATVSNN